MTRPRTFTLADLSDADREYVEAERRENRPVFAAIAVAALLMIGLLFAGETKLDTPAWEHTEVER